MMQFDVDGYKSMVLICYFYGLDTLIIAPRKHTYSPWNVYF